MASTTPSPQKGDPDFLQDVWTYYFHDPDNADWNFGSYVRLGDVSTIDDFWDYHRATEGYVSRGMFFIMREHVYPCWDDKLNITGGCISMKVLKEDLPAFWDHLVMHMLGERLFIGPDKDDHEDEAWSVVNGLSVSPKRYFCIVKMWLRNDRYTERRHYRIPQSYTGEVLYRTNTENIKGNNQAMITQIMV
jgi:hypothetical protein